MADRPGSGFVRCAQCGQERFLQNIYCAGKVCGSCRPIAKVKHGLSYSRLYRIWTGMLNRCRCEKMQNYKDYGGRGIEVCEEWKKFEAFRDWALSHGYADDLTIERRDNDLGYFPENSEWIPRAQQERNKRNNRRITAFGKTMTIAEWVEETGLGFQTIWCRLRAGWPPEDAVSGHLQQGTRRFARSKKDEHSKRSVRRGQPDPDN